VNWTFESLYGPTGRALGALAWDGKAMLASDVMDLKILAFVEGSAEPSVYKKWTNRINGIAFGPDGLLYGCQEGSRRVVQYAESGALRVTGMMLDGNQHNHPHQLVIDSKGRIWFTDTLNDVLASGPQVFDYLPFQSVLRLSLHGRPHTQWEPKRMTFDSVAPRGIALAPDESTLYVAENDMREGGRRELRAYPIRNDGSLGSAHVLHSFGSDVRGVQRGIVGLCVDADGHVIACGGWSRSGPGPMIYVFEPGGRIVESQSLPADMPVACAFGGADLETLYVSTADGRLLCARGTGYRGKQAKT
jgi:gluconolactonase